MFSKWLSVRLKEMREEYKDETLFAAFVYSVVTTVISVAMILDLIKEPSQQTNPILEIIFVSIWIITFCIPLLIFVFKKTKDMIFREYLDYAYFKETGKRKRDTRIIDEDGMPIES